MYGDPHLLKKKSVRVCFLFLSCLRLSNRKHRTIKRGILDEFVGDVYQSQIHILPLYSTITQREKSIACWRKTVWSSFCEVGSQVGETGSLTDAVVHRPQHRFGTGCCAGFNNRCRRCAIPTRTVGSPVRPTQTLTLSVVPSVTPTNN